MEINNRNYWISDDRSRVDVDYVFNFLSNESYWSKGIPKDVFLKSIDNSLCFSLFAKDRQVGFARIISDYATIAYLGDVFIDESLRGQGLGKMLMEAVVAHPALQGLRRWILATSDAHGLYSQYLFTPLKKPEIFMERHDANVYRRS
jgi:GNAT superfamily N-acetyltransferase